MRIRTITIRHWRHFENIQINLDTDASLACVVGANGTGKSHLLELIAACAHKLGLAQGVDIPRGDPFKDEHDLSLRFHLAESLNEGVDINLQDRPEYNNWDRTLTISSQRDRNVGHRQEIVAGGVMEAHAVELAQNVVSILQQSQTVHFLCLDANRAYPKRTIHANEIGQAYETDWKNIEFTRGRSFKPSTTLYDEWIKYCLAQENQAGTELIRGTRQARQVGESDPVFKDHFLKYKEALSSILPHIAFNGIDSKKRTLLFDTTGLELSFDQLSGGEREIAFLVGQVDRFGLRQGLFLLDEPELHLNADLIRVWVGYLMGTMETGQIWLATHSLEAVEAAGQSATFVLERNGSTRKVDRAARLDERPVLSALSRAVGSPAFSISRLAFVFVEGEEGIGERERYRQLSEMSEHMRFIECGSCNEVTRRLEVLRALGGETQEQIRMGGVIDRDFRTEAEVKEYEGKGIHVLTVHEVENLFLHPSTLERLLRQNGRSDLAATELLQSASDARAGSWILQRSMATRNARDLPELNSRTKEIAKAMPWSEFVLDEDNALKQIAESARFDDPNERKFVKLLRNSVSAYRKRRTSLTLWKVCEGKELLQSVARKCGFAGVPFLVSATIEAWNRSKSSAPAEVRRLRRYLEGI